MLPIQGISDPYPVPKIMINVSRSHNRSVSLPGVSKTGFSFYLCPNHSHRAHNRLAGLTSSLTPVIEAGIQWFMELKAGAGPYLCQFGPIMPSFVPEAAETGLQGKLSLPASVPVHGGCNVNTTILHSPVKLRLLLLHKNCQICTLYRVCSSVCVYFLAAT